MRKNVCIRYLCCILLILPILSGCGKNEENSRLGIDGYVYTAQQIDLNKTPLDHFKAACGYVYYCIRNNESRRDELRRFSVEEMSDAEDIGSVEGTALPAGESLLRSDGPSGYITDYTVDEKGGLYYLMERMEAGDIPILRPLEGVNGCLVDDVESQGYVLVKQLADGSEGYCVSLPVYPRSLALGRENRIYVLTGDSVFVIDENGRLLEQISVAEGEYHQLLEGEGGTVYCQPSNSFNTVNEIVADGQSGSYRLDRLEGPCYSGNFSGSPEGLFYTGKDGMLYRYRREDSSWETVLRWGDSNLACNMDFTMLRLTEDRMAVVTDILGEAGLYEQEFYLLTKTPVEELPEKEVLVMATCFMFNELERYIMDFNRNSEDYHITIRYTDMERMDVELVSSDPPDLINLTYLDYIKYGEKDVLEDLTPYLEGSARLKREDFREAVLDSCTVKGRLAGIPDEIDCFTVIGRASQLGSRAGWTAAEAMAFTESHPQARLFVNNSFSAMIEKFFRYYILERFIDWEKGECYFDGDEFIAFIKWAAEHSDGVDSELPPIESMSGTMPEERLLNIMANIGKPENLLCEKAYFGEEITAVGYPTAGGEAVHDGTVINQLGIVASSDKKEGAWYFIESFLARENGLYTSLPSRRDRLEEMVAKRAEMGNAFRLPDMTEETFDAITEDDLEQLYAIIDKADFAPMDGIRKEIINIIVEEMSPCLSGTRAYEDAADIVQNRVRNMVQE